MASEWPVRASAFANLLRAARNRQRAPGICRAASGQLRGHQGRRRGRQAGNPSAPAPVGARGDFDADVDVDLADFAVLQGCIPTSAERAFPCVTKFDYDGDQAVSLEDFVEFASAFTRP